MGAAMNAPRVLITDLPRHVGRQVELAGWLYNIRSKGSIRFLQIRDGSGRVQGGGGTGRV